MTLGIGGETDGDNFNIGGAATLTFGQASDAHLNLARSRRDGTSGTRWSISVNSVLAGLPAQLYLVAQDETYGSIRDPGARQQQSWRASFSTGFDLPLLGRVSPRFTRTNRYDDTRLDELSANWSFALPLGIRLGASASLRRENGESARPRYSLRTHRQLSRHLQLGASVVLDDDEPQFGLQFSYTFGNRGSVQFQGDRQGDSLSRQSTLRERTRFGDVQARWNATGQSEGYSVSWQGALVMADGLHLGAPVNDGVAVVSVDGIRAARVLLDQQVVGRTNGAGKLVVPDLRSFNDNRLYVEVDELPMGYSIDRASQTVIPPFKGGGTVEFRVVRLQAVEGRLFYDTDGTVEPGQYSSLEILTGDEIVLKSVTGFGGMFYLEDLQPGHYRARAYRKQGECHFDLTVPVSEFPIVSVGDITCQVAAE